MHKRWFWTSFRTFSCWKTLPRKQLHLERLRAAFEAHGGESWNKLAGVAGISHPTLSRILTGQVRAVNSGTLHRLAQALQVPPEWLTGERTDLPFMPEWGPLGQGRGPSLWEKPTAGAVRDSWLMQRIDAALHRDLQEWFGANAQEAYESWGRGLFAVIDELSSSLVWRFACLEPSAGHEVLEGVDDSITVDWLAHILEPWLQGKSYLNAEMLGGIFEALRASPARMWGSDIRDSDGLRALKAYAKACEKAVSARLAELGPPDDD